MVVIKFLTIATRMVLRKLRLGLSHLRGRKFKHNFGDCFDEICVCGKDIESTTHLLLQCFLFLKEKQILINKIRQIDRSLIDQNEKSLCYTLSNLNKSKSIQLIVTTLINDTILFELNIPFLFLFVYSIVS